ncbi:MAG: GntR family transcriptional regulator [Phycisphaerae bacterium]
MQFQIDHSSIRPVYQQIIDQVKRDIALGKLVKDEKLPTVRELAGRLVINPNTIAKAFRQLEQEGVIVTRSGAGAFVAKLDNSLSKAVRKRVLCEQMDWLIVDAVHMQIEKQTLEDWFNTALEKFKFPDSKGKDHE